MNTNRRAASAAVCYLALCGVAMGQSTAAGDTPAEASDKMPPVTALFDLKRSASEDVIYFRNKDVLRGRVLNETVTIATQYGMLKVPMRRCAGLSFEGARENTEAVVTVNFNRITGIVTDRVINFESKSSETKIPIRKEKIRFLLLQKTANEADFIEKSPKADLFLMANGDLLSGEAVERKVTIRTSHAKVPVSFAEMKDVTMQGADNVTAVIIKVNGDTMRGTLETDEITLDLQVGIQVEAIDKDKFARVFVDQAQKQAPAEFEAQQPIAGESDGTGPCPARAEQKTMALDLGDGIKMQLVLIPAGKFVMGAPGSETGRDYDEGPQRRVAISSSFYKGVTEVTQDQYAAIMGENPSKFSGLSNPVEQVSWEDAVAFCKALSKKTGQTVRLPTEAQWEYACRAGSKTRFSFGDDDRDLGAHAWYKDNSDWKTHPVGKKKANAWGLYDMHGNVTEWCSDRYAESYALLTTEDPQGPDGGKYRVHRGGEWLSNPAHCRAADRYRSTPDFQSVATGFRVAVDLR